MAKKQPSSSTVLPWIPRIYYSTMSVLVDVACRPNITINRTLLNFFDIKISPNKKSRNGLTSVDIAVDPARDLWFRLYTPTEPAADISLPVILFFHGGGFATLRPDSFLYDPVCRRFAREIPAVVVSVNYRLSPENRFPSQYDDGFDVLKFLDGRSFDGFPPNADLSRCFLAGDSAGANLAHHVACRAGKTEFRAVKVMGLIAIQPFYGGEERTESELRLRRVPLVWVGITDWMWKALLPEGCNRDHEAVNVSGPNAADISVLKYPATLVCIGGFDPLQDWQRRYYEWLKRSGKEATLIEYPNAAHAFYWFPELPESSQLITHMRDFIQKQSPNKHVN
ncbi:PREDICTED: probable carboxylesterase 18 [Nelumbo nucifera]|uniref:Alpha/beta hydrolase fold-3 domain-containing protein n=2 Tax=Nelumbo nucifera TaxID=4432 RepID=A0A822ZBR1_NELNU|nr:PREDICTED: probable carboxylesterase 18 [Nelumbo nucifera]DAD38978.1 TPA_asm: hypothetical protein HUJ06_013301 [Nelumbo nucifera]